MVVTGLGIRNNTVNGTIQALIATQFGVANRTKAVMDGWLGISPQYQS